MRGVGAERSLTYSTARGARPTSAPLRLMPASPGVNPAAGLPSRKGVQASRRQTGQKCWLFPEARREGRRGFPWRRLPGRNTVTPIPSLERLATVLVTSPSASLPTEVPPESLLTLKGLTKEMRDAMLDKNDR
jgi:hypothetical protein